MSQITIRVMLNICRDGYLVDRINEAPANRRGFNQFEIKIDRREVWCFADKILTYQAMIWYAIQERDSWSIPVELVNVPFCQKWTIVDFSDLYFGKTKKDAKK